MDDKYSDYLYHYTTIEKLALILKNRTIRLNPLSKMDDLQEQKTADIKNLGRFIFVSSWTDDKCESIPMWNMYTRLDSGVRIGLRKNPFVRHTTSKKDAEQYLGAFFGRVEGDEIELDTFANVVKMLSEDVFSPQGWKGDILRKIEYTDDIRKLEPVTVTKQNGKTCLDFGTVGYVKNTYWEFQREWRYIMHFVKMPLRKGQDACIAELAKIAQDLGEPPFKYYDLDIAEGSFAQMVITPSPRMTPGNRVLLESIIEKYNPTACVKESELLGLI